MFIVDDDDVTVRNSLGLSLQSVGYRVKICESAGAFLKVYEPNQPGCIILDVHMPESTGLDLQEYLVSKRIYIPVIFITGQADVPTVVRAVKQGAVDFLLKPFDFEALLQSIQEAIELDQIKRTERAQRDTIEERLASLTPRERDVLDKVIEGKLNKIIAAELEVSIRTVEIHRARLMAKMKVRRPTELARLVLKLRRSL